MPNIPDILIIAFGPWMAGLGLFMLFWVIGAVLGLKD